MYHCRCANGAVATLTDHGFTLNLYSAQTGAHLSYCAEETRWFVLPEVDGIRLYSSTKHEFVQQVPGAFIGLSTKRTFKSKYAITGKTSIDYWRLIRWRWLCFRRSNVGVSGCVQCPGCPVASGVWEVQTGQSPDVLLYKAWTARLSGGCCPAVHDGCWLWESAKKSTMSAPC